MYMIPDDDYDTSIKHAMLHADLSQIYDMSKEKRNLILPYEDRQKIIRKSITLGRQLLTLCPSVCVCMHNRNRFFNDSGSTYTLNTALLTQWMHFHVVTMTTAMTATAVDLLQAMGWLRMSVLFVGCVVVVVVGLFFVGPLVWHFSSCLHWDDSHVCRFHL